MALIQLFALNSGVVSFFFLFFCVWGGSSERLRFNAVGNEKEIRRYRKKMTNASYYVNLAVLNCLQTDKLVVINAIDVKLFFLVFLNLYRSFRRSFR